jgi:hypothetical protein
MTVYGEYIKDQWNHVKLTWLIHWASEGGNGEIEKRNKEKSTTNNQLQWCERGERRNK